MRAEGPFVPLNLGTLSKELMVSELFGHQKGAFTGAESPKAGRFAEADKGTLFLDEISTADEQVQVTLLRVLDRAKFRPIGAKSDTEVDVRIIAAANENLDKAVLKGTFRADLLHRFEVLHIHVPPLRQRKADIRLLSRHFLEQVKQDFHFELDGITDEAFNELVQYAWPGNVRELKNVIAHAAVIAGKGSVGVEHLPSRVTGFSRKSNRESELERKAGYSGMALAVSGGGMEPEYFFEGGGELVTVPLGLTIEELQKTYVLKTLAACGNNKTRAARQLGISRKTLYDRLTRWHTA